jgi:hypothetical protein
MHLDTVQIFKFNETAGHGPISDTKSAVLAEDLITEECNELINSFAEEFTDEERFKEMLDTIWVILSYCIRRGWNVPEGFRRLGESNLSKFNTNGDGTLWAEYFPSGKVKKSINYKPVDLSDLVDTISLEPNEHLKAIMSKTPIWEMEKYPS